MLAYSLFFGHGCQNRLFRIQAPDLVMRVSRHFSCSNNCRRSTSSRLKVAYTAHYNSVIARVTKQMFTNVKTKAASVEERNFSDENSILVYLYLKSSVQLFMTQFCSIYVTAPLFPGGFRKKTNSWCARIAVNLNVHIQKITLCSYGKRWFFSGRLS